MRIEVKQNENAVAFDDNKERIFINACIESTNVSRVSEPRLELLIRNAHGKQTVNSAVCHTVTPM